MMSESFGAGFHVAPGKAVDAEAYEQWTGRWSRLFVPSVVAAANVSEGFRVLDVSTGTGEAARAALPIAGSSGVVVGADISGARSATEMTHRASFLLRRRMRRNPLSIERETREDTFPSFDDYWAPVETGIGSIPQAYLTLSDAERRMARDEVRAQLSRFRSGTGLRMSVEMLIGQGRA